MSKNDVNNILEISKTVFEATAATLEDMQDGERIQLKELAKVVSLAAAVDPKFALNLVSFYVHNSNTAYITRGKKGGVVKGTKKTK